MTIDSRNESGSATKKTYSQETLKVDDITADVDPANKDTHLSDAEFEKKFDCDYEAFESSPNWKQVIMKKETWNIIKDKEFYHVTECNINVIETIHTEIIEVC